MASAAAPLIEAGIAIAPEVIDLVKKAISLFHHTKAPAAPGAPATSAGTVPLTADQAKATATAAANTAQSLIDTAVKNGSLPASAAPDAALVPLITQLVYSLMPQTPVAATTAQKTPAAPSSGTSSLSTTQIQLLQVLVQSILTPTTPSK